MLSKNTFIGILLLLVISVVIFTVAKDTPTVESPVSESKAIAAISQEKKVENYLPYNQQDFEKNQDKRRVLYFYANWCSTCRPANADFQDQSGTIPEDLVVFRVNYKDNETDEAEKELAKKYGITYQHTFVQVDNQGQVVTQWNGGETKELLNRVKK